MRYTNSNSFQKQVQSAQSSGFLSRCYWIATPNDYERITAIDLISKILLAKDCFLENFQGSSFDKKGFFDFLQSTNLFGNEPIAVITEGEKISKSELPFFQKLFPLKCGYLIIASKSKSFLMDLFEQEGVVLDLLLEKSWEKEKRILQAIEQKIKEAKKAIRPDVLSFIIERVDLDAGTLDREVDKLLCFIGDKGQIERSDVEAIISSNRTEILWTLAESIIWDGKGSFDESLFHPLVPALRSQMQMGLKIASLLETNGTSEDFQRFLPKVFPRILEKRMQQAKKMGSLYFSNGLKALFKIELQSRLGSTHYKSLIDFFCAQLQCKRIS